MSKNKKLKKIVGELKNASKMHASQADRIDSMLKKENFSSVFKKKRKKNPCWKGYMMVGTKKKGGRTVPNCVPKKKK